MSTPQVLINFFAYFCFVLGPLIIWPSRRNVLTWLQLPFFIIAYLIPLLAIDYTAIANPETISNLTWINLWGALAMMAGIIIGSRPDVRLFRALSLPSFNRPADSDLSVKRTFTLLLIGCTLMTFCFIWMQTVPLFADDPFLAKFFRGQYKERYDQVAIAYRLSQTILVTTLPLALAFYFQYKHKRLVIPIVWSIALFALGLTRGPAVAGVVLVIAAWASRTRYRMTVFLLMAIVFYCFGSSIYFLLGINEGDGESLWTQIALGAPDITDNLMYLGSFNTPRDLTYGLTFVGGLIPGNFFYNPAVYTLAIVNGSPDVSGIASGGLRLPPSVSGFTAFSWFGVIFVCLISGLLTGYFIAKLRRLNTSTISQHVGVLIWYQTYASFWIAFYASSYQGVIAIIILIYVLPNAPNLFESKISGNMKSSGIRYRRTPSSTASHSNLALTQNESSRLT